MDKPLRFLSAKTLFFLSLCVIPLTAAGVYFLDFGDRRSLFQNAELGVSILSAALFLFLSVGLYHGVRLQENVGRITDTPFPVEGIEGVEGIPHVNIDIADGDEGCLGILVGILLTIIVGVLLILFIWVLGFVIWVMILWVLALLYWVFYRAMKAVFRHSPQCRGNLGRSLSYAAMFTVLYCAWVYALLFALKWL